MLYGSCSLVSLWNVQVNHAQDMFGYSCVSILVNGNPFVIIVYSMFIMGMAFVS